MSSTPTPLIRTLNRAECDAVLARSHVGRIAYARGNRKTLTADDPAAFRQVLFRIAVQDVSGRESLPGGAE